MASIAAINNLGAYAHNPRGNLWFNDESTYGHKLLMKMGWHKGKGLGKNEDGIKENLKVKFRNTNSGLGFKDDAYANVMKTEYESILKKLSAEYSHQEPSTVDKKIDKQENKGYKQESRVVKSRLRYPKLFIGKDVSKYTEKDMKSIFICSLPRKDNEEEKVDDPIISHKKESENGFSKSFDTYSSDLSSSDYFAMKMKEKINSILKKDLGNDPDLQQTSLECESPKTETLTINTKSSSKRKRKNSEMDISGESVNDADLHQATLEFKNLKTENLTTLPNNKSSKKRRKNFAVSIDGVRDSSHTNENESEPRNFNKMQQKLLENSCESNFSVSDKICEGKNLNDFSCRPNKKKNKSRICENGYSSVDITKMISENTNPYETELSAISTKKKKKKVGHRTVVEIALENSVSEKDNGLVKSSAMVNGHPSAGSVDGLSNNDVDCSKKKNKLKKKKLKQKFKSCLKKKRGSYSVKNVSFNETISCRVIDSDCEFVDSLAGGQSLVQDKSFCEISDVNQSNASDNISSVEKVRSDQQNVNSDSCTRVQDEVSEKSDENCSLSSLPSSKSSHYNCWIESQRQALKMKMYKSMLKNIKKHDVLRTTNMLSIKGYGNWGFK